MSKFSQSIRAVSYFKKEKNEAPFRKMLTIEVINCSLYDNFQCEEIDVEMELISADGEKLSEVSYMKYLELVFKGFESGDMINLKISTSDICYSKKIKVVELFGDVVIRSSKNLLLLGDQNFSLFSGEATVGYAILRVNLRLEWMDNDNCYKDISCVDSDLFLLPVERISVSGGTAAFYKLKLKSPEKLNKNSVDYFIGKNLERAADEIAFYEKIRLLQNSVDKTKDEFICELLTKFSFEYLGVVTASEESIDENSLNLIVIRNLFDGRKQTRLLDFKMGSETASAGWKGKSYSHATRQKIFDKFTNSRTEGFRLEGFDGCPMTVSSKWDNFIIKDKKRKKLMYQNMKGLDVFFFLA